MRYLYKINSAYDGFTPKKIPERLEDGKFLRLGWERYLDTIEEKDEVWIVFVGGSSFAHGVYVQGLVAEIDPEAGQVLLRVRNSSTRTPLTDAAITKALLSAVDIRYRQVFLWPSDQTAQETCFAADCAKRQCRQCQVWSGIPQIEADHYDPPTVLRGVTVAPAYWVIPSRCFLYYHGRNPAPWVSRTTNMFSAFKIGEARYAYPFAAGMHAALAARGVTECDAIVPIPLSPEKIEKDELDRTGALAVELAALMSTKVSPLLSLSAPISKRRMQLQGFTPTQFKQKYRQLLEVDPDVAKLEKIVLLDDVITQGSTLSVAVAAIKEVAPAIDIVVASAGQMILRAVVADVNGPAW